MVMVSVKRAEAVGLGRKVGRAPAVLCVLLPVQRGSLEGGLLLCS